LSFIKKQNTPKKSTTEMAFFEYKPTDRVEMAFAMVVPQISAERMKTTHPRQHTTPPLSFAKPSFFQSV
jgi:hypothetical protein